MKQSKAAVVSVVRFRKTIKVVIETCISAYILETSMSTKSSTRNSQSFTTSSLKLRSPNTLFFNHEPHNSRIAVARHCKHVKVFGILELLTTTLFNTVSPLPDKQYKTMSRVANISERQYCYV